MRVDRPRRTFVDLALLTLLAVLGCDPSLGNVGGPLTHLDGGPSGAGGAASGALVVSIEPDGTVDSAPAVLRLHVSFPGFTFDPSRMSLVKGVVLPRELHELETGKLSSTLSKRLQAAVTWAEGAGAALAPTSLLEAGGVYTLVMADLPASVDVTIATTDPLPLIPRTWPPPGRSGTAGFAVWCEVDGSPAPDVDEEIATRPSAARGRIARGVVAGGAGKSCLHYLADIDGPEHPAPSVPPPLVGEGRGAVRLDPEPIGFDVSAPAPAALRCTSGEVRFGPGCATVLDDRIVGRSAPVPVLWSVGGAGVDAVIAASAGDPFVITGFAPASRVVLDVAAIDLAGRMSRARLTATTLPPSPHLVLNEVLAWPLGASPAEEWIEIVNDGSAAAELGGYVLQIESDAEPLPSGSLAPGAYALVVGPAYVASDGADATPPASVALLVVAHLGKRGLSKKGEELSLIDSTGAVVSRFPASPKPKQGRSVARRSPSAPDGLATSFALATPTPGLPNRF